MTVRTKAQSKRAAKLGLMLGSSLLGLTMAAPLQAQTASILRANGGGGVGRIVPPPRPRPTNVNPLTRPQLTGSARAMQNQAQAQQRVSLARQAQAAAKAAGSTRVIANGLRPGGLRPVANPVAAALDTTGLRTWQGALAPTEAQTANGVEVTVKQTEQRAILSWETFNVGADTTLTFDQKQNGVAQPDWVALNRVVGRIDPNTGQRVPGTGVSASTILGKIKSDGTVLVLNEGGVLFGAGSVVNTRSLLVSSLEIGRNAATIGSTNRPLTLRERNGEFLNFGLLGFRDQAAQNDRQSAFTFSPDLTGADDEGAIRFEQGSEITAGNGGFVIALAPRISNQGVLTASNGQVSLQSGRRFFLDRSEGDDDSLNPFIRGLVISTQRLTSDPLDYIVNGGNAIISADRGYVSLGASNDGAVLNRGILSSTTSVSRNGYIGVSGGNIRFDPGSLVTITPDAGIETIPQGEDSVDNFKTSQIRIGSSSSRIEIAGGSMLRAPSADVTIGAAAGATTDIDSASQQSRVFIDNGAILDLGGIKDFVVSASRNLIRIDPVKGNELRDTPLYRNSFLNGATVVVDPRLSGVRDDGVRWVGSPLIEAGSYYAQVGVTASELMTSGGNLTLGVGGFAGGQAANAPDIIVKRDASIDVSGGWVRYQAGTVETTRLITRSGGLVDIGSASLEGDYVGVATGFTEAYPRQGASLTYANPVVTGRREEVAYTEGRDAGSLTLKGSAIAFDGQLFANAYTGARQALDARVGTASSGVYGDVRNMQAVPSELPSGGYLNIQALSDAGNEQIAGGGDIRIGTRASITRVRNSLEFGQSFEIADSTLTIAPRDTASLLTPDRRDTIQLSDRLINTAGLGQINLQTSGGLRVDDDAAVNLTAGGAFTAIAGRRIRIGGEVTAPGGTIGLQTVQITAGSAFADDAPAPGSFDIIVNGLLSTRGLWINDLTNDGEQLLGGAFTDGGAISMAVASRVAIPIEGVDDRRLDISGSILINEGARVDVSGGGYVDAAGAIDTTATGGDLTLISQTNYFQLSRLDRSAVPIEGAVPGIRVTTLEADELALALNPAEINARIKIAQGSVLAHGFGGGGTFTMETPAFSFGSGNPATGARLSLDFFSEAGFATYDITSYGTALIPNQFNNDLGGFNALLATQTLEIGSGEKLRLSQSRFDPNLTPDSYASLSLLDTGDDLYSVLTPIIPEASFDRLGVDLRLGGLLELHVGRGGSIQGDSGASVTASKIWNEGAIRLIGGTLAQSETLLSLYADARAARRFEDFFTVRPDGLIDQAPDSPFGIPNGELALQPLYLLGLLDQSEGIRLSDTSVTDLSGASLRNPRLPATITGARRVNGVMVDGGTLSTASTRAPEGDLFTAPAFSEGVFSADALNLTSRVVGRTLIAEADSRIDISGASDTYTIPTTRNRLVPTPQWSAGGSVYVGAGGTLSGSHIDAGGGAAVAQGGTLTFLNPILTERDTGEGALGVVAADQIEAAGFDTFVALGQLTGQGDVRLTLDRGFFLRSQPYDEASNFDTLLSRVSAGGRLTIEAPYISLSSLLQAIDTPLVGEAGNGRVLFAADTLDVSGAVLFDRSIASVELRADANLRLIGGRPVEQGLGLSTTVANSLRGQLLVNGDLTLRAGQVYPTTGSTFLVASAADDGLIRIVQRGAMEALPYSAGSNLLIQAARIEQAGTVRAPLGRLTLGSNSALVGGGTFTSGSEGDVVFAPATQSVTLAAGSLTSVSAGGLSIPYGTTTDQIEYYFTPTSSDPLTAPPTGVLRIVGESVTLDAGSRVDIAGGGDVYAYEFIPGTGGSRDVLDRFNNDPFSGNDGFQFPDGRQIYAIVPGLSAEAAAAFDPIYSADYSPLYNATDAGKSVYLEAVPGLEAGWYTLLPARYALLPGGRRIVEMPENEAAIGLSGNLADGTTVVSGYYGVAGTDLRESNLRIFTVQTQEQFRRYSNIVTTSANDVFAARAARNGLNAPRLPIDAGRLILEPVNALLLEGELDGRAARGGRSALVDISGDAFRIVSTLPEQPADDGAILLTASGLSNLRAGSLFIGGTRTENSDGTTDLQIRARSIAIENDASDPLFAPELLFATDGSGSSLTVADGAAIVANGTAAGATGDYIIDGDTAGMTGQGAILRVANGPERLVLRRDLNTVASAPLIDIGRARLDGDALLIGASGNLLIDRFANLVSEAIALEAGQVTFAERVGDYTGLVVTPQLQQTLAGADRLTIRSSSALAFETGSYAFNDLVLDSPGFAAIRGEEPAAVLITADALRLANSSGALGACTADGPLACGDGALDIIAGSLTFGSGTVRTYGFGNRLGMQSSGGIYYDGIGGFDAGPAAFTLSTRFIADAAVPILPDIKPVLPSLTLASTGDVTITQNVAGTGPMLGTPGAKLSVSGANVVVNGSLLRASAGQLDIRATEDVIVRAGAVLQTPGYAKVFGDADDRYSVAAPGGQLTLTSLTGDISLDATSRLSVGGGQGRAGALKLAAAGGELLLAGTLDGAAPGGNASLAIETGGAFDLTGFAANQNGFTGTIDIRADADLVLTAGARLDVENLRLASEAGAVDIAGTIDASGVNGGDVALFGREGVFLRSGAFIDARAAGYGNMDSRQAFGGDVMLATDDSGSIDIERGARIEVGARRTGNRLIPVLRNGEVFYSFVGSDLGGTVTMRAPLIEQTGGDTVDIGFAGSIRGARTIAVEAFKRWDLGDIAANDAYTGVVIAPDGTAVLDTGQTATGRINFLSDIGDGTIASFIRDLDISASYRDLGGLAARDNFVARPGVELVYDGDVRLASNWNFAAADVDIDAAVAGGAMRLSDKLPGKYIVNAGREADLLENYADFLYRVGGSVNGAPGTLTLRAGGDLTIAGSITDGLFTFGDQTDPDYLSTVLGSNVVTRQFVTQYTCFQNDCTRVNPYPYVGTRLVTVSLGGTTSVVVANDSIPPTPLPDDIPFNAAANSAAALGAGENGAGDPLGSAQLFPILSDGSSAGSWSYQLVGGAELANAVGLISIDPLRTDAASSGSVSVEGERHYSYGAAGSTTYLDELLLQFTSSQRFPYDDLTRNPASVQHPNNSASVRLLIGSGENRKQDFLRDAVEDFFAGQPAGSYTLVTDGGLITEVRTTGTLADAFLTSIEASFTEFLLDPANGQLAGGGSTGQQVTAYVRSLVRTGTGSIDLAAAGNVDLRNGSNERLVGSPVYTVGHLADTSPTTARDMANGTIRAVDPTVYLAGPVSDAEISQYRYGVGDNGLAGVLIFDPVYATGGGDIAVTAGGALLGRRDTVTESRVPPLTAPGRFSFFGAADQPWRTGSVGDLTNLRVNPHLFTSGIGALGGGSISLAVSGDVRDLTLTSLTSVTTADVAADGSLDATRSLVTWGGGDIDLDAGGDLRGGRIDLARGEGVVRVRGSIRSANPRDPAPANDSAANLLRLRLSDARIAVEAGGSATLQGIAALGANGTGAAGYNSFGFYSPASAVDLMANGTVEIWDQGDAVVTGGRQQGPTRQPFTAVYPATVNIASLTGDLSLTFGRTRAESAGSAQTINLFPSPIGQLRLFAGGDVAPVTITVEDRDPGLLPGYFSVFSLDNSVLNAGQDFNFPTVLPDTTDAQRAALHNAAITHLGDPEPIRIGAGGDIVDMILSSPKQVRIGAGRDIVNMMLFTQNIAATDVSRVIAGRDIIATSRLTQPVLAGGVSGDPQPALLGNTFIIGGPGAFSLEAGRDAGPFLNSAVVDPVRVRNGQDVGPGGDSAPIELGGGIISIGNEWNPALGTGGADVTVMFGVAGGVDYAAIRETYVNPANADRLDDDLFVQVPDANGNLLPDRTRPIYGPILIAWMRANAAAELAAAYGTTRVNYQQAYDAFVALPALRQRSFLINDVYFNELEATSRPDGPSYLQYSRGYRAVNTLFPPERGYTENNLEGGEAGASDTIETGNIDLRLATIQTARGGDIALLGPGGRILAGSTVRTTEQAARRTYDGTRLFSGDRSSGFSGAQPAVIQSIPTGFEGVLSLRGGAVRSFTDTSLLLNQSRLFTQSGGDITLWSSNGDLNAGQGPKTAANFPPVVVRIDENGFSQVDAVGGVAGAGIAAFQPAAGVAAPDVFLIAPRGTVDAGDAGVRVAGNLFVAAAAVANADNFQVGGTSIGVASSPVVDAGAAAASNAASAAAAQAAQSAAQQRQQAQSQIFVEVTGYAGGSDDRCDRDPRPADCPAQ